MTPAAPIGVFDSGVGGLTVVAELARQLPDEEILYLGDTARLPYGTKSRETVARYSQTNVRFLLERGVKAIVLACNTASALALDTIDAPVPVWGVVEPGAEAAVAGLAHGPVGVLATESTIRSGAYEEALRLRRPDVRVLPLACPLFVPLVEEGWADDPVTETVARRYLGPLLEAGVERLLLGCTHYPALRATLERIAGPDVEIIDSAAAVTGTVRGELRARGLERPAAAGPPRHHLCVTDTAERFARIAAELLGEALRFEDLGLEWVDVRTAA